MKFMGSKARIAKYIVPILQKQLNEGDYCAYIEPFVGGANVIEHIKHSHKLGLDCSVPLIELLKYATQGGQLPDQISVNEYKKVKESPWNYPLWFVGAKGI